MTAPELAWWNYQQAEKRLERAQAANDPAAISIARSQAEHWFKLWLDVDHLAANGTSAELGGSTAPATQRLF